MRNKKLYAHDNTTYLAEFGKNAKREQMLASPFSYNPNPLLHRSGSARIKCHLKVEADRITVPVEAEYLSKFVPGSKYEVIDLVSLIDFKGNRKLSNEEHQAGD